MLDKLSEQLADYSDDELALLRDFLRGRTDADAEIATAFAKRRAPRRGGSRLERRSRA